MTVAQAAAMLGQPVVKGDNWYPRPPRLPCFVFCGNVVLWNGAEAVVTGDDDTVKLLAGAAATVSGARNVVKVIQTGNVVSASGTTLDVAQAGACSSPAMATP